MLIVPTLAAFMRTYPEIMLDLDFSDRIIDVIEEVLTPWCASPTPATRA
jgi:DNA-binding transcriptional LysR family regulator